MLREQSLGRDPPLSKPCELETKWNGFSHLDLGEGGRFLITDKELLFRFASDKAACPVAWPLTSSRFVFPFCPRRALALPVLCTRATGLGAFEPPARCLSSTPPLSLENSFAS